MSELGTLFDAVVADLAADTSTSVVFGTRERARQINQGAGTANRVVFEPLQTEAIANLRPPRMPGGDPQRILCGDVAATIYVWACAGGTSEQAADERQQYEAVHALFARVVRAIWTASEGQIAWGRVVRVNPDKRELVLGQEWAVTLTVVDDFEAVADSELIRDATFETDFVFPAAGGS